MNYDMPLQPGKLDASLLASLLARSPVKDPRVLLGPGLGRDVAVIDMGETCLVAKSDPITFATDSIGWYAVHVNANDIATSGARPRWFLVTLLLPERTATRAMVEQISADLFTACRDLGIDLIGGHTEVTIGLDRPILSGLMLGEVSRERLVLPSGAQPGDRILLTKRVAVEGTALIARECGDRLAALTSPAFVARCAGFLRAPGISVLPDAQTACRAGGVHAMHDPTEGGLATGLREMAIACGCGLRVDRDRMPFYPETLEVCEALDLDPLGLIASGSLLIAADPLRAAAIQDRLGDSGIECSDIGEVTGRGEPCRMITVAGEQNLPEFGRDEVARLFARED